MLFLNNVHYMAGVETCNFIELIMLLGGRPSLHSSSHDLDRDPDRSRSSDAHRRAGGCV